MRKSPSRVLLVTAVFAGAAWAALSPWARNALAADGTVAVLGLEATDGTPDAVAAGITEAVRQRVASSPGMRLLPGRDLLEVKLVFACSDEAPACMSEASKSMGAAKLVFGSVKKVGADAYLVTLKLLDAGRSVVDSWISEQISKAQSSGPSLRAPVQKWVATLTGQALPATLRVQGGVVGASVVLDGVTAGVLGSDGLLIAGVAPGKHELTISKPGHETVTKTVTLGSGAAESVAIEMKPSEGQAAPPPAAGEPALADDQTVVREITPAPSGRRLGLLATGWALAGAGVLAVVVGVRYSLRVLDANEKLDPYRRFPCAKNPSTLCDQSGAVQNAITDPAVLKWMAETEDKAQSYQTWQYVWYGAGGAFLASSIYFFYRGYASDPPVESAHLRAPRLQFAPVLGPGILAGTLSLRF